MAINGYLIIDKIPGPSTSRTNAIDILSMSVGSSLAVSYGEGASGMEARVGRPNIQDLSVMKVTDKTSPFLFEYNVFGKIMPKVEIYYGKMSGGTEAEDFFRITLNDAVISSYQVSASTETPMESISFAFQKIEIAYKPEGDTGSLEAWTPKGFDLGTLKAFAAGS